MMPPIPSGYGPPNNSLLPPSASSARPVSTQGSTPVQIVPDNIKEELTLEGLNQESSFEGLDTLSGPQIRVLIALKSARGPLSRAKISTRCGYRSTNGGHVAIGMSDPATRTRVENSKQGGFRPSLLTLGYVREYDLNIDGIKESVIELTETGRKVVETLGGIELPPVSEGTRFRG